MVFLFVAQNVGKQWVPLEHQVGPAPYRPPRGGPDARRGEGRDRNRARMPRDATAPAPQNANPTFTTDNSVISETHTVSLFSKQQ